MDHQMSDATQTKTSPSNFPPSRSDGGAGQNLGSAAAAPASAATLPPPHPSSSSTTTSASLDHPHPQPSPSSRRPITPPAPTAQPSSPTSTATAPHPPHAAAAPATTSAVSPTSPSPTSNSKPDAPNSPDTDTPMDPLDTVSPLDSSAPPGGPPGISVTQPGGGTTTPGANQLSTNNGTGAGINNGSGASGSSISGVPQPKVHTAFIHKLYNMLEDSNIQHLIAWSSSNDSFMVTPSNEFSRVLAQYFKHTNVSSFVRQLNMYGFHKVNDVFHTGPPDSTVWEFKHGNGSFKRGDLVGLREIKRRASRHALIQRDSFSSVKGMGNPNSGVGTPNDHGNDVEARLMAMEHNLFDLNNRLSRTEDSNARLNSRCQQLVDGLFRCHQWSMSLSHKVAAALPQDSHLQRDIQTMQQEIERHIRILEEPQDVMMRDRQPYIHVDSAPISPRGRDEDPNSRRPSFAGPQDGYFRPPAPPNLPIPTPRRMGSMSTGPSSPTSLRPPQHVGYPSNNNLSPFSTHQQHTPPSHLSRRHTSADIRLHGWNPPGSSPFSNNGTTAPPPPPHWPPSSSRKGSFSHDNTREVLAAYEFRNAGGNPANPFASPSAQNTPPHENGPHSIAETGWTFQNAKYHPSKESMPATRRSSLVSNSVHALLNPEANNNREMDRDDGVDPLDNDRKRKRLQ